MKTVICTVGTSIAQGTEALRSLQQKKTSWDEEIPDLEKQIQERLRGIDLESAEGRSRASAEINSLNRLGMDEDDRVILLATDTADGRVCANAVADVLVGHFGLKGAAAKVVRVPGLQVRDAKGLREQGLPNLIGEALRVIDDPQLRYGGEIVLNPTGGFKGVVPFLTVLGMLFGLRTVYVFEFADSLISLPPLPVSFDLRLYERALPAIELVHEHTAITEQRFFEAIENFKGEERDLFGGFIERAGDGRVTLSTLALVLLGMDSGVRALKVLPSVKGKLDQADPAYRAEMERYLIRSTHPIWRRMHGHPFTGSSLQVFGERSGPRIAGILSDEAFHVTSFHLVGHGEHKDYEKAVAGKTPSDFPLDGFVDLQLGDLESANDRLLRAEQAEIERLNVENGKLRAQLRDAGQPYRDEIRTLKATAAQVKGLRDTVSRQKDQIKSLNFKKDLREAPDSPEKGSSI